MKTLIAVITCHKYRSRMEAQLATWAGEPMSEGMDIRFFLGRGESPIHPQDVFLDVDDNYGALPAKVKSMVQWAYNEGYDYVFKTDDDVYIRPERLAAAIPVGKDYVGRRRDGAKPGDVPYCSGMGYWLSRKAMEAIIDGSYTGSHAEDVCTANILHAAGIHPENDKRYVVVKSMVSMVNAIEGVRKDNDIIAACEYPSAIAMQQAHREFLTLKSKYPASVPPPDKDFNRMDVMVKTFLRDGFMIRTTKAIEHFLPGARIILLDDGWQTPEKTAHYNDLRSRGHVVVQCDYDIGYGTKNNLAAPFYNREFVLRASDDFDFADDNAVRGVRAMFDVLDHDPNVGIASGRMNEEPYEGILVMTPVSGDEPKDVVAVPAWKNGRVLRTPSGTEYIPCDFTVNYSLIRTELMRSMVWDEKFKIGGDHMDIYLHANKLQWDVVGVPSANINALKPWPGAIHPDYGRYRGRARLSLPHTYRRHNWKSFTGFDGITSTMENVEKWAKENAHHFDFTPLGPGEKRPPMTEEQKKALIKDMKRMRQQAGLSMYGIKAGYKHRDSVPHFDDTPNTDLWQDHVYAMAEAQYTLRGFTGLVIDIGCGSGYKLNKYFADRPVLGTEVEPTLSWLKENVKFPVQHVSCPLPKADMVICSDVIEHVEDPDELLEYIKSAEPKIIVISTPERSLMPLHEDGPPRNIHHFREWNSEEFTTYLSSHFQVLHHIVRKEEHNQTVVCRPYDPV